MNWNKLKEEKCPNFKCESGKVYAKFESTHADLDYNKQVEQYICNKCGYGIYAKTMPKFIGSRTTNFKGETYKFLQKEKPKAAITQESYYLATRGVPMN